MVRLPLQAYYCTIPSKTQLNLGAKHGEVKYAHATGSHATNNSVACQDESRGTPVGPFSSAKVLRMPPEAASDADQTSSLPASNHMRSKNVF